MIGTDSKLREESFTAWLTFMTDRLAEWFAGLDPKDASLLDGTEESLQKVGELILAWFAGSDEVLQEKSAHVVDGLASYVGEVFRTELGLKWRLESDEENAYFGLPVVATPDGVTKAPHSLIAAVARRRDPRLLGRVFSHFRTLTPRS